MCIYIYIRAHIHTHTHIYINIYIHIFTSGSSQAETRSGYRTRSTAVFSPCSNGRPRVAPSGSANSCPRAPEGKGYPSPSDRGPSSARATEREATEEECSTPTVNMHRNRLYVYN